MRFLFEFWFLISIIINYSLQNNNYSFMNSINKDYKIDNLTNYKNFTNTTHLLSKILRKRNNNHHDFYDKNELLSNNYLPFHEEFIKDIPKNLLICSREISTEFKSRILLEGFMKRINKSDYLFVYSILSLLSILIVITNVTVISQFSKFYKSLLYY